MRSARREAITFAERELRGSRLRCLMLTAMPPTAVASLLTKLTDGAATVDAEQHAWMPEGFLRPAEARLDKADSLLSPELRESLTAWWLMHRRGANTPNWDIASSCSIEGRPGLLLVEAKAHDAEAKDSGKEPGNLDNDTRIAEAIGQANCALNELLEGWSLTSASHYQLCNRFAWAWKLASLGVPTALVYLGFLNADEMAPYGRPFQSPNDWEAHLFRHSNAVAPRAAWGNRLQCGNAPLHLFVKALDVHWF